jgi:hypothetical protein
MTNDYSVIGEHIDDEHHLLVVGADGQHYDYSLLRDEVSPVTPNDRWRIDRQPDGADADRPAAEDDLPPES